MGRKEKVYKEECRPHLYVSTLRRLVGVEDTDTNRNTSCAPM